MLTTQAQLIIETLAAGIDPATGEVLPDDGPLSSPTVIRALFLAAIALEGSTGRRRLKTISNGRAIMTGKPWHDDEDVRLLRAFDAGVTLEELAKNHMRNLGGIQSRLVRHGRLQEVPGAPSE